MSQNYQPCQLITEEGNLSGPIRTGHNQHTHTGNTVPRVYPPSRGQLEDAILCSTRGMPLA